MIFIEVKRMQCGKSSRMRASTMDLAIKFRAAVIQFGNIIRVVLNGLICLIQLAAIHGISRRRRNRPGRNIRNFLTASLNSCLAY